MRNDIIGFHLCVSDISRGSGASRHNHRLGPKRNFVTGLAPGVVALIAFALLANRRLKIARRKVQQAKDLADHREFERNLAQPSPVSKRNANWRKKLSIPMRNWPNTRSMPRLPNSRFGAGHKINNPLLGILSHLELVSKHDERTEVEQCIEGAKRIPSAVQGLLDYARPGPLLLGKVSLFRLVGETLKFVDANPCFAISRLQILSRSTRL